ncbi:hypothetical protein BDZ91DRAFT_154708 [Kalaharituber pfeilii]|nr:hypothetical protein BDZ91DRAFT_154708 [Kalaharituber pfeilii]
MEEASRKELFPVLAKLMKFSDGPCKVKIFIASRGGQRDVKVAMSKEGWSKMGLEKGDTGGDIRKYVETQTEQVIESGELLDGDVSEELQREVVERLVSGAEGMFLWVRYQIGNLCEQETEHDLYEALKNLPSGIEETYTLLLSKINSQSPSRRRLAERVLKWMLCSTRPLTPRELVEAVAIDPTTDQVGLDPKKMAKGVEAIVDVCGNLISYDEQLGTLRFVHFTVKEFLEKRFVGAQEAQGGVAEE